jgi:hypothetical protein
MLDIAAEFAKYANEFLEFGRIMGAPSRCPDLCAFLLFDKLVPSPTEQGMVSAAAHDEIYLRVDPYCLAQVATSDDVLYLVRCGVIYESSTDSLKMFA